MIPVFVILSRVNEGELAVAVKDEIHKALLFSVALHTHRLRGGSLADQNERLVHRG